MDTESEVKSERIEEYGPSNLGRRPFLFRWCDVVFYYFHSSRKRDLYSNHVDAITCTEDYHGAGYRCRCGTGYRYIVEANGYADADSAVQQLLACMYTR